MSAALSSALVLLGFACQLPILLFGALGGVRSDRMDQRRLMLLLAFVLGCST